MLESFSCIHLVTHGASVLAEVAVNTPMESRLFLFNGAWDGLEISCLRPQRGPDGAERMQLGATRCLWSGNGGVTRR